MIDLYNQWGHLVYGFILRVLSSKTLASELTAEVFYSFANRTGEASPAALLAEARALALNCLRNGGQSPRQEEDVNFDFKTVQRESSPDGLQWSQALKEAQSALEPKCKAILEMAYFSGMAQKEIEHALCLPDGSTGTRLRRAVNDLRRVFSL